MDWYIVLPEQRSGDVLPSQGGSKVPWGAGEYTGVLYLKKRMLRGYLQLSTTAWKEVLVSWGLVSSSRHTAIGQGKMSLCCAKGSSYWILGKSSFLKRRLSTGRRCPGKWWGHHLWQCSQNQERWHCVMTWAWWCLINNWAFTTLVILGFFCSIRCIPIALEYCRMEGNLWWSCGPAPRSKPVQFEWTDDVIPLKYL